MDLTVNNLHLAMIREALGLAGQPICESIVVLREKAAEYDKLMKEKSEQEAEKGNKAEKSDMNKSFTEESS